jgi:hypothetical protein
MVRDGPLGLLTVRCNPLKSLDLILSLSKDEAINSIFQWPAKDKRSHYRHGSKRLFGPPHHEAAGSGTASSRGGPKARLEG